MLCTATLSVAVPLTEYGLDELLLIVPAFTGLLIPDEGDVASILICPEYL